MKNLKHLKCLKCKKPIKAESFYGLHANCFLEWFKLSDDTPEFKDLDPKKSSLVSSAESVSIKKTRDSFYHGRYRKYSAILGSTQYILKVKEQKYPDLPAMEYLCNKIASLLGINVPEYYLIRFEDKQTIKEDGDSKRHFKSNSQKREADDESEIKLKEKGLLTFVTKNFMQCIIGSLHHIYKYLPKGKEHYNCETLIKVIQEQTGKLSSVENFLKICLFDSLIGNNDRHGRNLGIIDTGKKKWLSPMYDNPSCIGTEELLGADLNYSGAIFTAQSKEPKASDYLKEFTRLNFKKPCLSFITKLLQQFPLLIEEIKSSEISEKRKQAFIKYLRKRLSDFKQVLKEE